jgi:hypothetical protein
MTEYKQLTSGGLFILSIFTPSFSLTLLRMGPTHTGSPDGMFTAGEHDFSHTRATRHLSFVVLMVHFLHV